MNSKINEHPPRQCDVSQDEFCGPQRFVGPQKGPAIMEEVHYTAHPHSSLCVK